VVALAMAVAAVAVSLVWLAWLSAPSGAAVEHIPNSVTVERGDTLWSIATRIAPSRDPRAEVAQLQRINHLTTPDLTAGQVLRTK
jgi:LysM repeat protein